MELRIVSAEEEQLMQVAWFEIDTPVGNFIIHRGHAPMMVSLVPEHNINIRLQSGKEEVIHAHGGFVHITRRKATIILGD